MPHARIFISSPFGSESSMGNSVSARRIADLIAGLGFETTLEDNGSADVLIALHATRSAGLIERFHHQRGQAGRSVLVLPGSDLYRDLPAGIPETSKALGMADALAVYQPASLADIPAAFRDKATVVGKSADVPRPPRERPARAVRHALILAHLRLQKDPFLPAEALGLAGSSLGVQIDHIGAARDPDLAERAAAITAKDPRYQWLGELSHEEGLRRLDACDLLVNSSLMEGGANAICEAIALGVPVLATAIPGNIGMLGDRYPGYFPAGDARSLAALLTRVASDPAFVGELGKAVRERQPLFTPSKEREAWAALLARLLPA